MTLAEVADDVVVVPTPGGQIKAWRMGRSEAGLSRWRIRFPWGVETFFGTSAELVAHAEKRVAEEAAADAPRNR